MVKVDVAVSVYGKPYQTATTLASLLQHSGQHINRIFFQEELVQPYGESVSFVAGCFDDHPVTVYRPQHHQAWYPTDKARLNEADFRRSLRYQLAWETTDQSFLFITHNDCLYSSDIVGGMIDRLADENFVGVGIVGQCWNCPAFHGQRCHGTRYLDYSPTYVDAVQLVESVPSPRTRAEMIDRASPMPFPECRLNEFACMINVARLRPLVMPEGSIVPFGTFTNDIGTEWFRELSLRGYRFLDWHEGLKHGPFSEEASGHAASTNQAIYHRSEALARDYLSNHYPVIFERMERLKSGNN